MKIQRMIIPFLLFFGLYSISSVHNLIDTKLYFFQAILFIVLLIIIILIQDKISIRMLTISISINIVLWFYTILTGNSSFWGKIQIGGYIPYILFSLLLLVHLKDLQPTKSLIKIFNVVNLISIALALLQILNIEFVNNLIRTYYAFGEMRVINEMIFYNKPVMTFGTHSIAGFYIYLFFFLNLKTYLTTKLRRNLVYANIYLIILFYLNSVTGFIFLFFALLQLLYYTKKYRIFLVFMLLLIIIFDIGNIISTLTQMIQVKMAASGSGILGRYSNTGVLQYNLAQIKENPFMGTGLYFNDQLYGTDSGYVINWLRGSFPLLVLVYFGFLLFLKRNISSKKTAYFIWFIFMAFELGFPNLFYIRTFYILPFVVTYLNFLNNYSVIDQKPKNLSTLNL